MIEVLKEGSKHFVTVCPKCGCLFRYDVEDVTGHSTVPCPWCNDFVTHELKNREPEAGICIVDIPIRKRK